MTLFKLPEPEEIDGIERKYVIWENDGYVGGNNTYHETAQIAIDWHNATHPGVPLTVLILH